MSTVVRTVRGKVLIGGMKGRPWSREEELALLHGFVDLDLAGHDLQEHLQKQGYARSVGAIDVRLKELGVILWQREENSLKSSKRDAHAYLQQGKDLAARTLRAQIALAKLEKDTVSPYKKGNLEWE